MSCFDTSTKSAQGIHVYDRQPYNNLSTKIKWQEGVTQGAAPCHLVSYRVYRKSISLTFELKNHVQGNEFVNVVCQMSALFRFQCVDTEMKHNTCRTSSCVGVTVNANAAFLSYN